MALQYLSLQNYLNLWLFNLSIAKKYISAKKIFIPINIKFQFLSLFLQQHTINTAK